MAVRIAAALTAAVLAAGAPAKRPEPVRGPLMRDFMGINGHTVQFKPELYSRVCRLVRDYHGFDWDVGGETDYRLDFPFARNRVNWNDVYGSWRKGGFETDVCVMFKSTDPGSWTDLARDARRYGEKFARFFGPTRGNGLVSSVEIGNEPGNYDDDAYRTLFKSMAAGLRKGDSAMRILPCNLTVGESGEYAKSVKCIRGLERLYDALNIHVYAFEEMWPVWRRVRPEDPAIRYLREVRELIEWRDRHAPGKEVWVTEFGWDACAAAPPREGDAAKFEDVDDDDQARYLVRSFLIFARMGVDRAYIFFFNDEDDPTLFACSGITRGYAPKPAFHAVAWLYRELGDYRFSRVVEEDAEGAYVYEFRDGADPGRIVWAAWAPGTRRPKDFLIRKPATARMTGAKRVPLNGGEASDVAVGEAAGAMKIALDGTPVLLSLKESSSR